MGCCGKGLAEILLELAHRFSADADSQCFEPRWRVALVKFSLVPASDRVTNTPDSRSAMSSGMKG